MKKNNILILVACFISMLFIIQSILALTANSSNYSVGKFGTGMATSNVSSTTYEALFLIESRGTTQNAESSTYVLNIGFFDDTPNYDVLSIKSYLIYPKNSEAVAIIRLYISALNYESVWVNITRPDGVVDRVGLVNKNYEYYEAGIVGRYNVTFYANNSIGAIASVRDYFIIGEETESPPVIIVEDDGGTRTIVEECDYIWDCTPWRVCSGGKQTRGCKNIGTCTGTENKPIEEMNCSVALFDIVLQLEDITLNENRNLLFDINLTEKEGVNNVDVIIKYSLINKEGYEMFSQIETKAIQGNLYYQKEIQEIQLTDGKYILRVDVLYGNLQRASAEQTFMVINGKIDREILEKKGFIGSLFEELNYKTVLLIVLFAVVVGSLFILWLIIVVLKKSRKRDNERDNNDLVEKNLREGLRAIERKDIIEAKSIYENLRRIYIPRKDPKREIYNRIKEFYNKILNSKALMISIGVGLAIVLFQFLFSSNALDRLDLTGNVINLGEGKGSLIIILIFSVLAILVAVFLFWDRIKKLFKKEPPENTISSLMGKKVYSSDGYFIGEVKEVILEKKRIHSLKIALDKKHKSRKKGIVVEYKNVKSIKNVVIIDERVLSHIN